MVQMLGAVWRKSTRSNGIAECVEVAVNLPGVVGMRDSKDPGGPALRVAPVVWMSFAGAVKAGYFDPE